MAKADNPADFGSWPYALELFERGEPAFVDEIRRIGDADRLGAFAARWFADSRPAARKLLFNYLSLPANAFRHEPLVKRLFKLAEKAGDDAVMAHFLVLFDRSVRRVVKKKRRYLGQQAKSMPAAEGLREKMLAEGYESASVSGPWQGNYQVLGQRSEEIIRMPSGTAMPRPRNWPRTEWFRQDMQRHRLFSLPTRRYLRRRAWRYFRKLGKQTPERYLPAVCTALKLYENADVADGLALIDNWGLVHILFHHSPVLEAKPSGWVLVPGKSLTELKPAPIFEEFWKAAPQALIDLLRHGRCRPVRQWAVFMIRRDPSGLLQRLRPEELFGLLASDDPAVVRLAAEIFQDGGDLASVGVDRLLGLLETPNSENLEVLCALFASRLGAERVTVEQAARLAASRPLPSARLGFTWLQIKAPTSAADCQALLRLTEAQSEPLRPELAGWLRGVLGASPYFQSAWVLEFLDSRHADVREVGWKWLREDARTRDDVEIWKKLLESPYDDVRLRLIADLEERVRRGEAAWTERGPMDAELLRFLWASTLLNIHRGSRVKPVVVSQLVGRMARRAEDAPALLPILAVALRSVRGPEWRAGLSGVVQLMERNAELALLVRQTFPELIWE